METVKRVHEVPIEVRDMAKRILLFHVGRERAISRGALLEEICLRLGSDVSDRQMRKAIEDLREEKLPICSNSDGRGYFWASSVEEVRAVKAEYLARIGSMSDTVRHLEEAEGQITALPLSQGKLL